MQPGWKDILRARRRRKTDPYRLLHPKQGALPLLSYVRSSLGSFILIFLRCIPEPPKLLKPVAHTCPCETSSSLLRSSAIRFFYYTSSSSRSVCPPAIAAFSAVSTWALGLFSICYLCLRPLSLMSPLRLFFSVFSFILILFW